jgi:hypothetical protein
MKLRLALGIGFLALLIVALASWGSSLQRSVAGTVVAVGTDNLPLFAPDTDDAGALVLCTPAGEWPATNHELNGALFVHIQPFTRILDGRGWLLSSASSFEKLRPGQQIEVWTSDETTGTSPPQVYAIKIEITGDVGAPTAPCRWQEGSSL